LHLTRSTEMEIDENASQKCRWFRVSLKWRRIALNLRFNTVVTFLSIATIWFFVIWCSIYSEVAYEEMTGWMAWITKTCTWMYIGTQYAWAVFIIALYFSKCGRRGGLMVSALVSGSSGSGSSPGRGHCVVYLRKTLYSHGAPLHPGV